VQPDLAAAGSGQAGAGSSQTGSTGSGQTGCAGVYKRQAGIQAGSQSVTESVRLSGNRKQSGSKSGRARGI